MYQYKRVSALLVVGFLALGAVLSMTGLNKFSFDASADTLIDTLDSDYIRTQVNAQMFGQKSFIIVAYKPEDKKTFSEQVLSKILTTEEELVALDGVESTLSLATVPIFINIDYLENALDVEDLSWKSKRQSAETLSRATKSHPIYENALVNEQQDTLGIQVVFKADENLAQAQAKITAIKEKTLNATLSDEQTQQLEDLTEERDHLEVEYTEKINQTLAEVQQVLKPLKQTGTVYVGGNRQLGYELKNIISRDLYTFGLIISGLIIVMLAALFRQVTWVVLPMITCAMALFTTLSSLGLLGFKVTVISANVITLQIILTLSIIIHLIVEYRQLASLDSGKSHGELVSQMVRNKFKPCLFAGLTTGLGFGSLVFSGIQPIISFGWMMMIALSVSIVVALVFFPAMLRLVRMSDKVKAPPLLIKKILNACAVLVGKRRKLLLLGWFIIAATSTLGIFSLNANNSFVNYFRESTETYRDLAFIDQEFGGSVSLDIVFHAEEDSDYAFDQPSLSAIQSITEQLDSIEETGSVSSIADFTRIARVATGKPMTIYEVNAIYEALPTGVRDQLVQPYFHEESKTHRISVRIKDSASDFDRQALITKIANIAAEQTSEDNPAQLSNVFLLYQKIIAKLVDSQVKTLAIVYAVMLVLLIGLFGSLRIAIIALLPNFATTCILFGVMGVTGTPLDLMTITIAAVAIGISVDDTIHYIHRYLKEQANDSSDAIKATHMSVGYALLYTTLIIVIGFGSLVFSDFMPSVYFGFLASITMLVALLCDVTLLPALLSKKK
ncbi:efflux RND transporter permease subunit [Reinekea thalattae]|uniref:MMPL family transporter n=1 Tax=Reinekea thalattae TaxID=2593301 RepID=A0A5C8Z295_9GAMM|nr:MMPL family transporter [Reinekea thalattae]TXR51368.1 MMPL family transporter [Reinekea thalattae]